MIIFPPAKINLGLQVRRRREDGFHELETGMIRVPFEDVLELLPAEKDRFLVTGIPVEGAISDNLCVRALYRMRELYAIPPVYMHLRKNIPMGAGLGGGSSDAAYVIRGLNELFGLGISNEKMRDLAAELGSDCAFFITGTPCMARGRGELLSEIELNLEGYFLKLVFPGVHVSTKTAYAGVLTDDKDRHTEQLLKQAPGSWEGKLLNDFEDSVFKTYPELAEIKQGLYAEGALYAAMSGSGSTIFGLFETEPSARCAYDCRIVRL